MSVGGPLIGSLLPLRIGTTLDGVGLALVPEDQVAGYVADGRLVPVLEEWWSTREDYHLYCFSRRQSTVAIRLLLDALRWHGPPDD